MNVLFVGLGSAIGGMARYGAGLAAARIGWTSFPAATLGVNLLGSFIIAAMAAWIGTRPDGIDPRISDLVMVGFCGGLTTYSSFNEQTLELIRVGQLGTAVTNVAVTLIGCGLAGVLGFAAGRMAS
jgi:CrcB protein